MMKKMVRVVLLILISTTLCGCAVKIDTNRYTLNSLYCSPQNYHSCYTLFVAEPIASSGFDSDQIVYVKCPHELSVYTRNRWVAPPNLMLLPLIAQSLRSTGYFKAVVSAPYVGDSQYRLETRLIRLQQEFFCCPSRVRMTLHVVLIDNHCHQVICEKVFEAIVPAPKNNPYSGVLAANKATQIILNRINYFVINSIDHCPLISRKSLALINLTQKKELAYRKSKPLVNESCPVLPIPNRYYQN